MQVQVKSQVKYRPSRNNDGRRYDHGRKKAKGDVYPKNLVKSKFLKLNYSHVEYVINCLGKNTTKVRNIKSYLLASLFNAGSTISSYYRAEVNHDMP